MLWGSEATDSRYSKRGSILAGWLYIASIGVSKKQDVSEARARLSVDRLLAWRGGTGGLVDRRRKRSQADAVAASKRPGVE